jgi:hypothetical protein
LLLTSLICLFRRGAVSIYVRIDVSLQEHLEQTVVGHVFTSITMEFSMSSQNSKDLGSLLILSICSPLVYGVFLALVPMSWIKWCVIDLVAPIEFLNIALATFIRLTLSIAAF